MLTMTLFEVDLTTRRLMFPQAGLLIGYVEPKQFYNHDTWLKSFTEDLVFSDDRRMVLETFQIHNYINFKGRVHCEFRLLNRKTGDYAWVYVNTMLSHDGSRAVGTLENIDELKKQEQELKFQAEHDTLTKLANRGAFMSALREELKKSDAAGMVGSVDIDHFKHINEMRGHEYGDLLLREISKTLRLSLPEDAVVGRYDGDEFMFFLPGIDGAEAAARYAHKIQDSISTISSDKFSITVSLGISFYPPHEENGAGADEIAAHARTALSEARQRGKNQFCIYHPNMEKSISGRHRPGDALSFQSRFWNWLRCNRTYALSLTVTGFLLIISFTLCTEIYTKRLRGVVDEESYNYLEEIASQMNTSLVKGMTSNYAILDSLATKLEQTQDWTESAILSDLTHEASIFDYRQMALIDEEGRWITEEGTYTLSELLPYIAEMDKRKEPVTTEIVSLFGEECVVFFCPLNNTRIGGRQMIGVAAMADMDMLNKILYLTLFDGAGYSHVVTSGGNIVIRSTHETNTFHSYNIFQHLKSADFSNDITVDRIRQDFLGKKGRKIHYKIDGQDLLSIYAPVDYNDWYLFTVIPSDILQKRTSNFYNLTVFACMIISALFLLLVAAIFVIHRHNRKELFRQLYTDPVTGGPNRIKFELDAAGTLRSLEGKCSVIYVNVEKFKLVNERDGNDAGNRLLASIYDVFSRELCGPEIVARLMADHFGILATTQNIAFLRQRIDKWNKQIQELAARIRLTTPISMNYGIFPVTENRQNVSLLLDKANLARKSAPRGSGVAVYDAVLAGRLQLEAELESRQAQALKDHEFVVYYQPKYCPETGRIAGAEALVRWITPDKGLLTPDKYIPLFEANGFILNLDLYVFDQTCHFLWRMVQEGMTPIPISVNVSRSNLNNPDFLQEYVRVWAQYHIDASLLEFEITESLVYENMDHLDHLLDEIHQYGFQVSMDDFGSGYSSLNMLKNVNIDTVKLDREFFIHDSSTENRALLIVKRLIELAKDLGMSIVAEGVETQDLVDFLRNQSCDMIQGFYYSRPIPQDDMWALLSKESQS